MSELVVAPPNTGTQGEPTLTLTVTRRLALADGVVGLRLEAPDGAALPPWEPGAHIDLLLADGSRDGLVRQYSLCGDPADRHGYEVAVLREPAGRGGSAHVHEQVVEGTRLEVRGPRNHFPLAGSRRYLFIAGGIGVTPILPMVRGAAAAGADWHLLYGGRTRSSMAFLPELTGLADGRVRIVPQDEAGLLPLDEHLAPTGDTLVYCCGPERLLSAVEERCLAWPAGALHVERFAAREVDTSGDAAFEVELAASGRTLTVPPDRSVLEVLEDAGVPILWSCREGTCGTCETGVVDGEVDHRDSLLTDAERAANDTMFVCVSRARGTRLCLDL